MLDRRLGLWPVLAILVVAGALIWGATQLLPSSDDPPPPRAEATPAASTCEVGAEPYGSPPNGFTYETVDEATRAKTVKALNLDEANGRVDMRAARQQQLTLGTLVGVPAKDPGAYAAELVSTAETGGAPVSKSRGFALIPLESGTVVAVGVRGCQTVLISAQDPAAVRFLATAVFNE